MESGAAFFILLGAFFLIGIPVLAIAAYVRAGELKKQVHRETPQLIARIYTLERQLTQIEKTLATLNSSTVARSDAPAPSAPTPAVTDEVAAPPSTHALSQMEVPRARTVPAVLPVSPIQRPAPVREHAPALSIPASSASTPSQSDGGFEAV